MTDFEELKRQFAEAAKAADEPINVYHESARIVVNIERQSYYGGEAPRNRLERIRKHFAEAVEKEFTSEA